MNMKMFEPKSDKDLEDMDKDQLTQEYFRSSSHHSQYMTIIREVCMNSQLRPGIPPQPLTEEQIEIFDWEVSLGEYMRKIRNMILDLKS